MQAQFWQAVISSGEPLSASVSGGWHGGAARGTGFPVVFRETRAQYGKMAAALANGYRNVRLRQVL